jgi:hypothetical protein
METQELGAIQIIRDTLGGRGGGVSNKVQKKCHVLFEWPLINVKIAVYICLSCGNVTDMIFVSTMKHISGLLPKNSTCHSTISIQSNNILEISFAQVHKFKETECYS